MLELKNTVIVKNDFDGLISGWDIVEESICELGDISKENSKTEKIKKKKEKGTEYARTKGQLQRCSLSAKGIPDEKVMHRKQWRQNFPKLMTATTDTESLENKDECQKHKTK